jgi:hypothetical protein
MRADICELPDEAAVQRFARVLIGLDAELLEFHSSPAGVDGWRFRIGGEVLSVFGDARSLDIQGPPEAGPSRKAR